MTASLSERTTLVRWIGSSMLASSPPVREECDCPPRDRWDLVAGYRWGDTQWSEDDHQPAGDEKRSVQPEPDGLAEQAATGSGSWVCGLRRRGGG